MQKLLLLLPCLLPAAASWLAPHRPPTEAGRCLRRRPPAALPASPRLCAVTPDTPRTSVGVDGGDPWSGVRVNQDDLREIADRACSTIIARPIVAQYYPSRSWLWCQWSGTVVRRVLPNEVSLNMVFAGLVCLFFRRGPGAGMIESLAGVAKVWSLAGAMVTFTLSLYDDLGLEPRASAPALRLTHVPAPASVQLPLAELHALALRLLAHAPRAGAAQRPDAPVRHVLRTRPGERRLHGGGRGHAAHRRPLLQSACRARCPSRACAAPRRALCTARRGHAAPAPRPSCMPRPAAPRARASRLACPADAAAPLCAGAGSSSTCSSTRRSRAPTRRSRRRRGSRRWSRRARSQQRSASSCSSRRSATTPSSAGSRCSSTARSPPGCSAPPWRAPAAPRRSRCR